MINLSFEKIVFCDSFFYFLIKLFPKVFYFLIKLFPKKFNVDPSGLSSTLFLRFSVDAFFKRAILNPRPLPFSAFDKIFTKRFLARAALYQLSYGPNKLTYFKIKYESRDI